ncbi:protein phosphatase 1 regulatory subunit 12A-like [Haliotis rufescens]|uniref:protein phosphatase 1 regulatory subunit 12A-like n=1 Tax=Haliotis rufescens TaxID=6454 RepID=UPI00201E7E8A|nr:protein phosphatase 1 regulatory subunit 12A-like [Haliotis rufescens]
MDDSDEESSLHSALELDMNRLKSLVQDRTPADIRDFLENYPTTADILNKAPWEDGNPLVWACQRNEEEVVTLLLEHGADPNYAHPWMCVMPLHYASDHKKNNLGIVRKLLEAGARINDVCHGKERTALHYACEQNNKDVVALLLAQGAVVDIMDAFMRSPLCIVKSLSIAKMLIDAGSDVNWCNGYPFHHHACDGNIEMVEFLMKNGASFNKDFITLMYACGEGYGHGRLLELMISQGGSSNEALRSIVMGNNAKNVPEAMEYLISVGASVNHEIYLNYGWRPLHMACGLHRLDKVQLLLDWGARTQGTVGPESEGKNNEGKETEGEETMGAETEGKNIEGQETEGEETVGAETEGKNIEGQETEGEETVGAETEGKNIEGKEPEGEETVGAETEGKNIEGQETEGEETVGAETEGKNIEGQETEGEETVGAETEGKNIEGKEPEGEETVGAETEGKNIEGQETEGEETVGAETEGKNIEGQEPEGEETGGAESTKTEGQDTQGQDTQGQEMQTQRHDPRGQETQGPMFPSLFQSLKGNAVTRRKRSRPIAADVVIRMTELLHAAGTPLKEADVVALQPYLELQQEHIQQRMTSLLAWYLHHPRTLREICRIAIRAAVPPKKDRSIDRLALPSQYKGYLKFNDING